MANKSKNRGTAQEQLARPEQAQDHQPGREFQMTPHPEWDVPEQSKGARRLEGKVALISGGDSGIGRAVSVAFAREGASVAIVYLEEDQDAKATRELIAKEGGECQLFAGNVGEASFCDRVVEETIEKYGQLDVLMNNAAEQHPKDSIEDISPEQLEKTFATNVFSMFYLTKAAIPHLRKQENASIVNTTSVTAYRGSPGLLDYSASKGAIVSFTRSLSQSIVSEGIRVNAVAPGPIWTPLIPATYPAEKVGTFGTDTPMGRAGQPWECATAFVFLASQDSSYMTGQVIHVNGGEIING
ncbi:General stress protein 39 [Thalassoglobus neptunius]|uniref:General stress protein 39 n=1 Tax=Thalassoglobus neptunius TaxID=1938619 RepID=A0A5C5X4M9_9PLAN|nr:SDR family oxidoreductase [Thalassoglobus neptunius]TWT58067.1 General stress protein 39 [Thalassoglobus neptunius]